METLAERLKNEQYQKDVMQEIVNALRASGEWGRHGLFAKIGQSTGRSPANIGQVLTGKAPLTENFVVAMREYLGISVAELQGETSIHLRPSGKTPDRAIELLRETVAKSSQSAVARDTGIRLYSIQQYLKGIGEPSQATLQRLADYFNETFIIEIKPRGKG